MRKFTLDRFVFVSAWLFQVVQFVRVFLLLDSGPLAWLSGITGGVMAASGITYIASKAPRIAAKRARAAAWGALGAILVISPVIVAITNYITADARLAGATRYAFAVAAACIADAMIAGVAFAGGSLLPVQSKQAAKPVQIKAIEPEAFSAICKYPKCEWSHNHYASQRAATNALTAHGRMHSREMLVNRQELE